MEGIRWWSADPDSGNVQKEDVRLANACLRESLVRLRGESRRRDCADIYPDFRYAVERLSGGTNTVLLDSAGMPSVMVRIESMNLADLIHGAPESVHPAFLIGDRAVDCLYISKFQNVVFNGRGYSLPMQDPQSAITLDEADAFCRAKGPGWGLSSFALRAAIALWTKKNGTLPHGNNHSGRDFLHDDETGQLTADGRVATGSGPNSWSHNGKPDGIFDLNGNVNEWDAGMRLQDGEIQILPGSSSLLPQADLSADSTQWRAILPDGTLARPGMPGTLRYEGLADQILLTTRCLRGEPGTYNCAFSNIAAESGLVVPALVKALMLFPDSPKGDDGGWRWIKNSGECLPLCGGGNKADDHAGIFFVGMTYPRDHRYGLAGFRSVYAPS